MGLSQPDYKYSEAGEAAFALIDAYKEAVKCLKSLRFLSCVDSTAASDARKIVKKMVKEMNDEESEMFDIAQDWSVV